MLLPWCVCVLGFNGTRLDHRFRRTVTDVGLESGSRHVGRM